METRRSSGEEEVASITFSEVDIVTPRGDAVCTELSCRVAEGESLMLTGLNATGKTSFARVLSGLWRVRAGSVVVSTPHADADAGEEQQQRQPLYVLPQRIYMTLGSLADQIT